MWSHHLPDEHTHPLLNSNSSNGRLSWWRSGMVCAMEHCKTCKWWCNPIFTLLFVYVGNDIIDKSVGFVFSPQIDFQVETDKGFKFSESDDSFICQKKNHFQITVTILFHKTPKFLKLKVISYGLAHHYCTCDVIFCIEWISSTNRTIHTLSGGD